MTALEPVAIIRRQREGVAMEVPGNATTLPELPATSAPRPHLLELLDQARPGQVVMVVAPPGYGKTVVLTQWIRASRHPRAAWVSLDRTFDADRFRSAVTTALAGVPGLPPDRLLRHLAGAAGARPGSDVVDELLAAFDDVRPPVRLVLDDVHELTDPDAQRELASSSAAGRAGCSSSWPAGTTRRCCRGCAGRIARTSCGPSTCGSAWPRRPP